MSSSAADAPSAPPFARGERHFEPDVNAPAAAGSAAPPDTGPSNAWSRVVASRGRSPATARKLSATRPVSHTISTGRGRPSSANHRQGPQPGLRAPATGEPLVLQGMEPAAVEARHHGRQQVRPHLGNVGHVHLAPPAGNHLPGADRIELMQAIRRTADAPVIFIAAYGREDLIARAPGNPSSPGPIALPPAPAPHLQLEPVFHCGTMAPAGRFLPVARWATLPQIRRREDPMPEPRKPIVTELALAEALERLVNLIGELRADADLRVEITTDETDLVKLTFSGTPSVGYPLQREVRDIPAEVVRRIWNEGLRNYEIIHRHHDAR